MHHQEWQERIPFYIAQTLSADELRQFELHLANCEHCQREIDEWRMVASAVWREADDVARSLPPLSQEVYNRLNYRDRAPKSRYSSNPPSATPENVQRIPSQKRRYSILSLVAGFILVIAFAGFLTFFAFRPTITDPTEQVIALDSTEFASPFGSGGMGGGIDTDDDPSSTPLGVIPTFDSSGVQSTIDEPTATVIIGTPIFATNTPIVLPTSVPTEEDDITAATIFDPTVFPTLEPTTTPLPTNTPAPPPLGGGPYITVTPNTFSEGAPLCEAFNPTGFPIEIFSQANRNAEIIGVLQPDEVKRTLVTSANGWYLVVLSPGSFGWIPPGFAYLRGNCVDSLPIATATATSAPATSTPSIENPMLDSVVVVNAAYADLHAAPNFNAEVIAVTVRDEQFPVVGYQGLGTNRWVLVELLDGSEAWVWASVVTEYPADSVPPTATAMP